MKVKVFSVKDIIKYLMKIGIMLGTIAVLVDFFYASKDVKGCMSIDSTSFLGILNKEVLLFNNSEDRGGFDVGGYFMNTINGEVTVAKMISNESLNKSIAIGKDGSSNNSNDDNGENGANKNNDSSNANEVHGETQETGADVAEAPVGVNVEVLPSNVPNKYTDEIMGVQIKNESSYNLTQEIVDLNTNFNKQDIMIFHTHTCESYTATEQFNYDATGTFRTTDLNYTVCRVGDELEKYLRNYGYTVVHDKTLHDYPAYSGSYNRSLITVRDLLSIHQNTDIVIDLHRDAIGDNTYAPTVKIGDEYCARIMFVIGTDGGGLKHDNWRENLKFAIKLQQKADELYPGLFKPIIVRNSRYNHQVSKAACIIEVGATGNTLEQCMNSMKYLSKIFHEM